MVDRLVESCLQLAAETNGATIGREIPHIACERLRLLIDPSAERHFCVVLPGIGRAVCKLEGDSGRTGRSMNVAFTDDAFHGNFRRLETESSRGRHVELPA